MFISRALPLCRENAQTKDEHPHHLGVMLSCIWLCTSNWWQLTLCGYKKKHTHTHLIKFLVTRNTSSFLRIIEGFRLRFRPFWVWHYSTHFLDFYGNKAFGIVDSLCSSAPINILLLSLKLDANIVPTEATPPTSHL